jgi:hypothetical protein
MGSDMGSDIRTTPVLIIAHPVFDNRTPRGQLAQLGLASMIR